MDIMEKYVKYLRCWKCPSSIHQIQKQSQSKVRKSEGQFVRNIGAESKSIPVTFLSNVRSNLKIKTSMAPLLQDEMDETSTKFDEKRKDEYFSGIICQRFH